MSSTPEIPRTVKFSPYGKPINKSLLTPCRQIGLSRKRKTPNSLTKIPLHSIDSSVNESIASPVTPLTHNKSTKSDSKECSINQLNKRPKRDVKENKDRTAKKCLTQNFQSTLQEEKEIATKQEITLENVPLNENILTPVKCLVDDTKNMQVISQSSSRTKSSKSAKTLKNVKVSLERLSDEDIESYNNALKENFDKNGSSSEEKSEEIIKVKKRKPAVLSSDDEDFEDLSDMKNKHCKKLPSYNNEEKMKISENISGGNNNVGKLNLEKKLSCDGENKSFDSESTVLNKDHLLKIQQENNEILASDFQTLSGSSANSGKSNNENQEDKILTKKTIFSDNDEDFENITNNKKKLTLSRKESLDKKQKSKEEKNKSKVLKTTYSDEKCSKVLKQTKSITNILDDEEDAFTSTPERDKNEKVTLIEKIKTLENEVKVKRKKVEDLRQAQIYKTKHNIEELKNLTNVWREGCVKGLHDLLAKLQMHGPINMSTLLNNLNIPNEIAKRSIKLELSEEKKENLKDDSQDFQMSPD